MPVDDLLLAADLTRRAIEMLDRAGAGADLAAAMLYHGLEMIEHLTAQHGVVNARSSIV